MAQLAAPDHAAAAGRVRSLLAAYREAEDLIRIGAYQAGSSAAVDAAVRMKPAIDAFLRQRPDETTTPEQSVQALLAPRRRGGPTGRRPPDRGGGRVTRFRFRFAVVLKQRERARDAARAAFAAALRESERAVSARRRRDRRDRGGGPRDSPPATAGGPVDAVDWSARRRHTGRC